MQTETRHTDKHPSMSWHEPIENRDDPDFKRRFVCKVRQRLSLLAAALYWEKASFDFHANDNSTAVFGEITLHHDTFYIHVNQVSIGPNNEILLRTFSSRRDTRGGRNHFVPIEALDDIPALAARIRTIIADKRLH